MDILKCNLYIIGNPGVGKTILKKMIEGFIQTGKKFPSDIFNGPDWTISTENLKIEVEIKESRTLDLNLIKLSSKQINNIILYITEFKKNATVSIPLKEVELLKTFSKNLTVIIASSFEYYKFDQKKN